MSCRHFSRLFNKQNLFKSPYLNTIKRCENTTATENTAETLNVGGFAKAYIRQSQISDKPVEEDVSFEKLLRNSKFIDLGDPEGRIVSGTIFHVVGDDLYIDFGWKFHCVCTRPSKNGSQYVRGAKVRLRVKDLELSTKFIGSEKDLTLLEADAQIIGLSYSPVKPS